MDMTNPDDLIARINAESGPDNDAYMSGAIDHDEYWRRVHARDAQMGQLSQADRARVQDATVRED